MATYDPKEIKTANDLLQERLRILREQAELNNRTAASVDEQYSKARMIAEQTESALDLQTRQVDVMMQSKELQEAQLGDLEDQLERQGHLSVEQEEQMIMLQEALDLRNQGNQAYEEQLIKARRLTKEQQAKAKFSREDQKFAEEASRDMGKQLANMMGMRKEQDGLIKQFMKSKNKIQAMKSMMKGFASQVSLASAGMSLMRSGFQMFLAIGARMFKRGGGGWNMSEYVKLTGHAHNNHYKMAKSAAKMTKKMRLGPEVGMKAYAGLQNQMSGFMDMSDKVRKGLVTQVAQFEALGISTESSIKSLDHYMHNMGMSTKEAQREQKQMWATARKYGIEPQKMQDGFNESMKEFAYMGTKARDVYYEMAVAAKKLGIEQKELMGLAKGFKMWDDAHDKVAEMNQLLQANVFDAAALNEAAWKSPQELALTMRDQLDNAGQSWENLGGVQKQMLAETAGMDVQNLERVMGGKAPIDETKKAIDQVDKVTGAVRDFSKALKAAKPPGSGQQKDFLDLILHEYNKLVGGKMKRNIRKARKDWKKFRKDMAKKIGEFIVKFEQWFAKMGLKIIEYLKKPLDWLSEKLGFDVFGSLEKIFNNLEGWGPLLLPLMPMLAGLAIAFTGALFTMLGVVVSLGGAFLRMTGAMGSAGVAWKRHRALLSAVKGGKGAAALPIGAQGAAALGGRAKYFDATKGGKFIPKGETGKLGKAGHQAFMQKAGKLDPKLAKHLYSQTALMNEMTRIGAKTAKQTQNMFQRSLKGMTPAQRKIAMQAHKAAIAEAKVAATVAPKAAAAAGKLGKFGTLARVGGKFLGPLAIAAGAVGAVGKFIEGDLTGGLKEVARAGIWFIPVVGPFLGVVTEVTSYLTTNRYKIKTDWTKTMSGMDTATQNFVTAQVENSKKMQRMTVAFDEKRKAMISAGTISEFGAAIWGQPSGPSLKEMVSGLATMPELDFDWNFKDWWAEGMSEESKKQRTKGFRDELAARGISAGANTKLEKKAKEYEQKHLKHIDRSAKRRIKGAEASAARAADVLKKSQIDQEMAAARKAGLNKEDQALLQRELENAHDLIKKKAVLQARVAAQTAERDKWENKMASQDGKVTKEMESKHGTLTFLGNKRLEFLEKQKEEKKKLTANEKAQFKRLQRLRLETEVAQDLLGGASFAGGAIGDSKAYKKYKSGMARDRDQLKMVKFTNEKGGIDFRQETKAEKSARLQKRLGLRSTDPTADIGASVGQIFENAGLGPGGARFEKFTDDYFGGQEKKAEEAHDTIKALMIEKFGEGTQVSSEQFKKTFVQMLTDIQEGRAPGIKPKPGMSTAPVSGMTMADTGATAPTVESLQADKAAASAKADEIEQAIIDRGVKFDKEDIQRAKNYTESLKEFMSMVEKVAVPEKVAMFSTLATAFDDIVKVRVAPASLAANELALAAVSHFQDLQVAIEDWQNNPAMNLFFKGGPIRHQVESNTTVRLVMADRDFGKAAFEGLKAAGHLTVTDGKLS